jgi:hypothetical protein
MDHNELASRIEKRLDNIDTKLDRHDSKLDKHLEQVSRHEVELAWIKGNAKLGVTIFLTVITGTILAIIKTTLV